MAEGLDPGQRVGGPVGPGAGYVACLRVPGLVHRRGGDLPGGRPASVPLRILVRRPPPDVRRRGDVASPPVQRGRASLPKGPGSAGTGWPSASPPAPRWCTSGCCSPSWPLHGTADRQPGRGVAPGVVNIEMTGRRLDRLAGTGGRFFIWRFLAPGLWWHPHPFSLSAEPVPFGPDGQAPCGSRSATWAGAQRSWHCCGPGPRWQWRARTDCSAPPPAAGTRW